MIHPLTSADAAFIHEHQDMYPREMREGVEVFGRLLSSGLCWGYYASPIRLVGWILFEEEPDTDDSSDEAWYERGGDGPTAPKRVYCYDVAVMEQYQHKGIMKQLCAIAYRELRWRGFDIRMHCRKASYPSPGFLWRHGYEIVSDRFIENHYEHEYGAPTLHGEHARELLLKPIGQR